MRSVFFSDESGTLIFCKPALVQSLNFLKRRLRYNNANSLSGN